MILVAKLISLMHDIVGQWRKSEGSHWTFNSMEESAAVGHWGYIFTVKVGHGHQSGNFIGSYITPK